MTDTEPLEIECPDCGRKQISFLFKSINVTLNPELKTQLLNAEINLFVCEHCGKQAFINSPLLYNDMEKKFCVQFYPPDYISEPNFLNLFINDGSPKTVDFISSMSMDVGYLLNPHIVFSLDEMVRYVNFLDKLSELDQAI